MITARNWREAPQRYRGEAGKCKKCSKLYFPPRLVCRDCGGREFETVKLVREGKVLTHTIIRTPSSQFSSVSPFAMGIVELEDGVKITTQIVDTPIGSVKTGMKVKVEFRLVQKDGDSGVLFYGYKCVPA